MKTLYLDCGMGAAGDMLTGALLELFPDMDSQIEALNRLGIPDVEYRKESIQKCGIKGTYVSVRVHGKEEGAFDGIEHSHEHMHGQAPAHGHFHDHEHQKEHVHTSLHAIRDILYGLKLPDKVKEDALAVYGLIAEAESKVHGVPVSQIHFHEVGMLDAVADITAVCYLLDQLAVEEIIVSPIHVGSGQVQCAHGILPVPAPATAWILKEAPVYGGSIQGELCTPTGAALLQYFATRFGAMPVMRLKAVGYGMGRKDYPAANCVRAMLGETEDTRSSVWELCCNIDDMTGEDIGFAMERLLEAGALEVFTIPAGMKKSRPGIVLHVLCSEQTKETLIPLIFQHTTTIGIRGSRMERYVLERESEVVESAYGPICKKTSKGYGVLRAKYEYEELARIAREQNISLEAVRKEIQRKGY